MFKNLEPKAQDHVIYSSISSIRCSQCMMRFDDKRWIIALNVFVPRCRCPPPSHVLEEKYAFLISRESRTYLLVLACYIVDLRLRWRLLEWIADLRVVWHHLFGKKHLRQWRERKLYNYGSKIYLPALWQNEILIDTLFISEYRTCNFSTF